MSEKKPAAAKSLGNALGKLKAFFKGIDRGKLPMIFACAGTVLVVLLAAVIPALFIPPKSAAAPETPATPGERAALFAKFWNEDSSCEVILLERSAFSEAELAPSGERLAALHDAFLFDDAAPAPESSGEHFYILRGENGVTLRMRELYESSTGDWSNWFRVFTDIDGDEIYFLYQSCKCLQNAENYDFSDLDAWTLASSWQDVLGAQNCMFLGSEGNEAIAAYLLGERALYYKVRYTSYTTPEYVVDFRFMMQAPEN